MVEDIEVAGEAGGGVEACERPSSCDPDVVAHGSVDARPVRDRRDEADPRDASPSLPVVILTAHADAGVEREAREAGASGFLAKGTGLDDIVIVLHEAAEQPPVRPHLAVAEARR